MEIIFICFCRALNVPLRELTNSHKNILDGQLLLKYVQMSFQERYDIARKMGTTAGQVTAYIFLHSNSSVIINHFTASLFLEKSVLSRRKLQFLTLKR